jgi:hypothetical protein
VFVDIDPRAVMVAEPPVEVLFTDVKVFWRWVVISEGQYPSSDAR